MPDHYKAITKVNMQVHGLRTTTINQVQNAKNPVKRAGDMKERLSTRAICVDVFLKTAQTDVLFVQHFGSQDQIVE